MNKGDLQEIDSRVSRFLQKASRKNEPLETFRETEAFDQFIGKMESGIQKQAKWLADNLDEVTYLKDAELKDSEFEAKFGTWLSNEMPRMTEFVSQEKIYAYLYNAFDWSIKAAYGRIDVVAKSAAGAVNFKLTNPHYIAALKNQANYLLNSSSIDETTRKRMITMIRDSRLSEMDINELSVMIEAEFEGISGTRAFLIANTETNQAMSTAQQAFLKENGFKTKVWVPAGPRTCAICEGNADDGAIALDQAFNSGDMHPPGHSGCECYEDAGDEIDLSTVDLWNGGGGDIENMILNEIEQVKSDIIKSEEMVMSEVEKKLESAAKKSDSGIVAIKTDLQKALDSLKEYMSSSNKSVQDAITKNGKPLNKTVIQRVEIPSQLIDILTMLSTASTEGAAIDLSEYKPHDEEEGDTEYYGFLHPSGAWYIVEGSENKQRYAAGDSDYQRAWMNRSKIDYLYIDEAFK